MSKKAMSLALAWLLAAAAFADSEPAIVFEQPSVGIENGRVLVSVPACRAVTISPRLVLAARELLLELNADEQVTDIHVRAAESKIVFSSAEVDFFDDLPTSASGKYGRILSTRSGERRLGSENLHLETVSDESGRRLAKLLVFPVTADSAGTLSFAGRISLAIGPRSISAAELVDEHSRPVPSRSHVALTDAARYVIITNMTLAPAFDRLARYKNETGYPTEVRLIEEIVNSHRSPEDASSLRHYLQSFRAEGGRFALLGGDETAVPIRYASHRMVDTVPPVEELQLCDLYFADLTGDWDVDGDGVYGEPFSDQADMQADLLVGRLPLSDTAEVRRYVDRLIRYETMPDSAALAYLKRVFFFASDQMRDYSDGGQHGLIAAAFPPGFEIDTTVGVEQTSGATITPTNPPPVELIDRLSEGYGIINIVAHGRGDGFVVKSANYNQWPKSYFLTAPEDNGHGCLDSIRNGNSPSFYYSLACDNGGFDLERLHQYGSPGLSRGLLGSEQGGAVGLVAYSRWGWVGTSHLLQRAFFDSLLAHPELPAANAFYRTKEAFSHYRDLTLGQNFYGDPTLRVYTAVPGRLEVTLDIAGSATIVHVRDQSRPVADCRVILSQGGAVLAGSATDGSGKVEFPGQLNSMERYTIAAVKEGYVIAHEDFVPSMVTTVNEDDLLLPDRFSLAQNYPNPFNPATTISFELPYRAEVDLAVYNILGRRLVTLVAGELAAGRHEVTWSGRDVFGTDVASGVYFYRLESAGFSDSRKMLLLR
jgi:hypothetical protein